jgi:hypothetical protein
LLSFFKKRQETFSKVCLSLVLFGRDFVFGGSIFVISLVGMSFLVAP